MAEISPTYPPPSPPSNARAIVTAFAALLAVSFLITAADLWRTASPPPSPPRVTLRLHRRLPPYQPSTHDTTPDGAGGRAKRVAVASDGGQPLHATLPLPAVGGYLHSVAICAVAKDQGADVPEWAAWHARLGVSKIWLYDDGSVPPLSDSVALAEAAGVQPASLVSVHHLPPVAAHPSLRPQMAAYDACIAHHRAEAAWLAFVDVDEFIVASNDDADLPPPFLPTILAAYPTAAAVVLHWRVFGGGGHVTSPEGGVVASYTACIPPTDPESRHIKTIARSALLATVEPCLGAHHFAYAEGWYAVDVTGRRVDGPTSPHPPTYTPLGLHHYAVKSDAEFAAKTARGSAMGNTKGVEYQASVEGRVTGMCDSAARVATGVGFADVFG